MDINQKREQEKQVVSEMIALYCHKNHHTHDGLCEQCAELEKYAHTRSDHCPFMENKTFCSNCKVHCYAPEKRILIKQVMRFSGPRMLFVHPVMAIRHMVLSISEKRKMEKMQ